MQVKYRSNTGQYWSNAGQIPFRFPVIFRSNTGRLLVKYRCDGQTLAMAEPKASERPPPSMYWSNGLSLVKQDWSNGLSLVKQDWSNGLSLVKQD